MATVSIDDVTLRALRAQGTDVDAWITALPTMAVTLDEAQPIGLVARSHLQILPSGDCPVINTRIELAPAVTYTRGGGATSPGPQLTVGMTPPESILIALPGRAATTIVDHPALAGSTIADLFTSGAWTYVNLDMPMHAFGTGRDLAAEEIEAGIRCDRLLARSGSRGAMRRLKDAGLPIFPPITHSA